MQDRRKLSHRSALKLSSAASVLGAALLFAPTSAHAQQVVPGTDPECPIVMIEGERVAICEGDLEDGITAFPGTPDFDEIEIRNPDAPIAPPGYFGVGVVKDNGALDILIEEGVVINVFDDPNIAGPAQGVIVFTQNGFGLRLETAADITADGNGSFALGIEAVALGGGSVFVGNFGEIDAFTSGDSAIALQARAEDNVFIINTDNIAAQSNGSGERDTATAGILAIANGVGGGFSITTSSDDSVSVTTGAGSFDTDFNGIAGAIVGIAFATNRGSGIVNWGNLTAVGPQTHGIVGFVESSDAAMPAEVIIASGGVPDDSTISTNGVGSFGILAQGRGEAVNLTVNTSTLIDMTATGGTSTGVFALNQAEAGTLDITNEGTITGRGDGLRGMSAITGGAPAGGDYVFDITNSGAITLDADFATGINLFSTRDDDVDATITNSGNIDLSAATDADSVGILASFGEADVNADPMADGESSVTITNSGDITMGAGVAIFAAADNVTLTNTGTITVTPEGSDVVLIGGTGSAQTVDLAFSGGDISSEAPTALFGGYAARIADATEGSAYSVSFDDMTVFGTVGLVSFGDLEDNTEISLTATDLIARFRGNDTPAILVSRFGDQSTAEFTLDRTAIEIGSSNTSAIDIAEIGDGSALTFNISNSAVVASGGTDTPVVLLGGLGGANSAINVNIQNTNFAFALATAFEIAKFAQEDSVSVFTVGGDSLFDVRRPDGFGIAVGTADVGPIDNFSSTIVIEDSRVLTFGDRSTGIFIDSKMDGVTNSDFGIRVAGVEISTDGESAHGIEIIGARNTTLGDRDNIAAGGAFADIVIEASQDITAAGANSDAIRITNQDLTTISVSNGALVSGGTGDAVAIRLAGAEANSDAVDEITDAVTVAKAKIADNAMNIITVYNADNTATFDPISIDMFDASGFDRLVQVDNATVESVMGAGAIVSDGSLAIEGLNGGIIRTDNVNAPVITAVGQLAVIASDTTFSSTRDNSPLFNLDLNTSEDGTSFYGQFTDVTATTTGTNSDAINMDGGIRSNGFVPAGSVGVLFLRATDPMAPNIISTAGTGAQAIDFRVGVGSTFTASIADTLITTQGTNAAAINILGTSTSSTNLELFDTEVATSGQLSSGIYLQTGATSDYTITLVDSEISTQGDDSAVVFVRGRSVSNDGNFVMIDSALSSMGDNSGGVFYQGGINNGTSSHSFFIAESSISTAGADSDGFHFGRDETGGFSVGSFIFQNSEITTSGADSDALQIGSLGNGSITTITAFDSRFVTQGDKSHALVSEALGNGSITAVSVADSSFATSGANSTALLINDRSPLDANLDTSSSLFSIDIGDSSIMTAGINSLGIDLASLAGDESTSVVTMQNNRVTTEGANSDAISIGTQAGMGADGASHTITIDFMDIETGGDDSRGIYIGSLADGFGSPALTIDPENPTDATFFIGEGSITTAGARSHGIEFATIDGDFTDAIVDIVSGTDQTITTTGDNAIGVLLGGVTGSFVDSDPGSDLRPQLSATISPLSVTTEGTGSHAIQIGDLPAFDVADNTSVTLTVLTREIATTGDGAHGVVIGSGWGEANSDANFTDPGSNRFSTVTVDGAINVSGAGSHGIVSDSLINDFSIADTGSITSADGFAIKFDGSDEDFTALNLGTIEGDVIFGGGDDTFDTSGIFTGNINMGGGANAIFVRAGGLFNSLDTILLGAGNAITVEGDISPGGDGPIQTTAIGSDLMLADGSRLLIDIDGMAADPNAAGFFQSDRITVDGNVTIGDATLAISSLTPEGDFDRSAQFLILDAAGTLTGEFSTINADLPFLDLSVTYDAGQAILNAGRQGPVVPFASLGLTPNQRAVGAAFDTLEPDATGDLDDVIEQLIFASTDQALTAFDGTSGEIYASLLAQAGNDGIRRSREALIRARNVSGEGWGIWGGTSFSDSSIDSDGNGASVDQNDFGFDFGVDYAGEANAWSAGFATGWRNGDVTVDARESAADYDAWYVSGYARYGSGGAGATVSGAVSFSQTSADVERTLRVNAFSRTALGEADIDTLSFAAEARYGFAIGSGWSVGPVVSVMHADSDLSLDDETGAGSVALTSADASDGQTRFGGGLFANLQSDTAMFDLAAQYADGSSSTVGARLAFAEGAAAPFTVLAPVADQSGLLTSASARVDLGSGWTIGAKAEALFGSDLDDVSGSVVLGWRF